MTVINVMSAIFGRPLFSLILWLIKQEVAVLLKVNGLRALGQGAGTFTGGLRGACTKKILAR